MNVTNMLSLAVKSVTGINVRSVGSTVGPLIDDQYIYKSIRQILGGSGDGDSVQFPYKNSLWVYASITTIARNLSKVPLGICLRDNPNKKVTSGDIVKLLARPNPFMTTKLFVEAISMFLNLYGESFLLCQRENVTSTPNNIYVFNPNRFAPQFKEVNGVKYLVGWLYEGQEKIPLQLHEALLLRYFNPYDDIRGLAPLSPSRMSVNQDYFISRYNENFFKQGVSVSGFIQVEDSLNDELFNRMISQFEERHQGYERAHKIAVLEGGAKFVPSNRKTQKDYDIINLKKMSRSEIFASYKVNEVVLGIYDAVQSYEGIKQAHRAFWEECMVPHLSYIEEYLNLTLFSQIENGKYVIKFDLDAIGPLHEDYQTRVETANTMSRIGFPINDINDRLELGMPKYEWGKVWWVPMGMVPADVAMAQGGTTIQNDEGKPGAKPPTDPNKPPEKPAKPGEKPIEKPTKPNDGPAKPAKMENEEETRILWQRYVSVQFRVEELMKSKIKKFLFDLRKTALENLSKNKSFLIDEKRETERFKKLMSTLYIDAISIGANMITEELGNNSVISFSLDFPEVVKYLQLRVSIVPSRIIEKIALQLEKIVNDNEIKELKVESVKMLFNKVTKRVSTIARTESSSLLVAGRVIQMFRNGVRYHKWVAARRDNYREGHASLNNKTVKIGSSFSSDFTLRFPGDLMAPIEETMSCTCFTVMAIKTDD